DYQGQTIRLRFRTDTDGGYNSLSRLDNLSLNIEAPGWVLSEASLGGIQEVNGISGTYLALNRYEVSAYSIPFLVPTNTDSLRFNYFNSTSHGANDSRPLYVYAYSGDNFNVVTSLGTVSGSQNEGWKQATLNLAAFRGRVIKLRFRTDTDGGWGGTSKIDNVELLYGATGAPAGNYPNPNGAYLWLRRYEVSAYSIPFMVLSTTESVRFDYQNWTNQDGSASRPLYIYALSEQNFGITTPIGTVWGSATEGWKQATVDLKQFRGREIKLRFRTDTDGGWGGQSKIDNIVLINGLGGSTGGSNINPDKAYLSLNRYNVSASSNSFLVPTGTQSLRFDYLNSTSHGADDSRPLYVEILPGPNFANTTPLGTVWGSALEGWKPATLNISAYQSQTVKLRFSSDKDGGWGGTSKIDNVYLLPLSTAPYTITEINLPNYTSTTSDMIPINTYGSANFTLNFGDYGVDRYNSMVEVVPLTPVADGVSAAIVTVTVRSGSNVPMAGQWVEVQAPGAAITLMQSLSPTDVQGRAVATIRSTRAQSTLVSARTISDNVTLAQAVPITFTAGTPSASRSALAAQPNTVSANGVNTALITVTLRDTFDNVVPGKAVTVTHDGMAIVLNLNGTTTNAQGFITGTLSATQAQTVTLRALDLTDNITVSQLAAVRFTTVDPQQSSILVAPDIIVANGVARAVVTVTLRDSAGVPLPNKPAQLLIDNTAYVNGQPAGNLVPIGPSAANGVVTAVVTSTVVGVKSINAYGDNVPLNTIAPITFTVGAVDVALSQLQADRSAVVADGVNYATFTARVVDNTGHPIPHQTVLIRSTGSQVTVMQPHTVTDAQGRVHATLKSTAVQNVVVSAFVQSENVTLTETVNLSFLSGPADVAHSLVAMTPLTLTANGTHWATITATLHDALDHPLSQRAIQLVATGNSNFFQPAMAQNTDAAGQVVFQLASTLAEAKQITVRDVAHNITVPGGTLTFVPGVISPTLSSLSASPTTGAADGITPVSLVVTVRDQFNNPIPGSTVALSATAGNAFTLTQPLSPTNSSGQAQGALISGLSQVITVTARANGVTLTQALPVRFMASDLTVEKSGPSQATATYQVTYTLRVRNVGLVTAQNTIVTDDLPANVTFITHTAPVAVNVQGQSLTWNFGTLNPNQTIEFQVVGYLELGAGGNLLTNFALATTTTADERLNNNQATFTTQVRPPAPQLEVSPIVPTLPVSPSGSADLQITIRNAGTAALTNVTLIPPPHLPWLSLSTTSLPDLAPGHSSTFTLTATPTGTLTTGDYRDRVWVQGHGVQPQSVMLTVQLLGPARDLHFTISNTTGISVSKALIQLQRTTPSVVVTEGSSETTYKFASGTSNLNGELTLPKLEVGDYVYLVQATDHNPVTGTLTIETGSGPQSAVIVLPALPRLSIEPNQIDMAVTRGQQDFREVLIRNLGAAPLTNVAITTPQTMPWTSYGLVGDMSVISPNQAAPVLIYANPPVSQAPGIYQDYLSAGSSNGGSAAAALRVDVKDTLTRTVIFAVSDNVNDNLAGADVMLTRQEATLLVTQGVTQTISNTLSGSTGVAGIVRFESLEPGTYRYQINAVSHEGTEGFFVVEASPEPLTVPVALTYYPFQYDWSVTPTTIPDTYEVTLHLTHDTGTQLATLYVWGDTLLREACGSGVEAVVYHAYNPVMFPQTLVSIGDTTLNLEVAPQQFVTVTVPVNTQCGFTDPHAVVSHPQAADGPTFTLSPNDWSSPLLTPTQVFAYQFALEVVNPFEGVTLEIGQPSSLSWIDLPNPYAGQSLNEETGAVLPFVLTATVPSWLAVGTYTENIPIILHAADGSTKHSWLTIEATQTAEGLRLHTTFDAQAILYTRTTYTVPAPVGVGCLCLWWTWIVPPGQWGASGGSGGLSYSWLVQEGYFIEPVLWVPPPVYSYAHQQVRIEISQDVMLEREAFIATLGLTNTFGQPLQDMQVTIVISDANGLDVTEHFASAPAFPTTLGDIAAGAGKRSQWTLVPGDLNVTNANGEKFYVSAIMSYHTGGESFSIQTVAREITVKPQPKLVLDYYAPGAGSICTKFPLQVRVTNQGYGWARNLKITSAQPRIYDNTSGLLVGFSILKAALGDQTIPNGSLTIPFGDLAPGESKEGSWLLKASQPGYFAEFWADFKHNNYLGLPLSPLIEEINTHITMPDSADYERLNRNRESIFLAAQTTAQAGRGVSTFSGYYSENVRDFSIDTRGLPLKFERSYNSAAGTETGPLGYGWSHNYERKLKHDLGEDMSLVTGRGSSMRFTSIGDGHFLAAPGVRAELVRGTDGVYTLTEASQVRYTFDDAGKLLAEIDHSGNRNTLLYLGTQLSGVRAPDGRVLHFAYEGDHLTAVTDPIARVIRFGYDAQGNLAVMTNTLGFTTTLTYDDQHRLTRMTDANGHTIVANEYDGPGRVTRQLDGLNQATRFGYDFEDCTLGRTVVITNARGFTRTDVYAQRGELSRQIDAYGNVISYTYDLNFNVASITDKNGHTTRYVADVRGNPLHTTDALSNVITNTYDSRLNLIAQIDALGRVTRKDYDDFGNVLTTTDALGQTSVNVYDQYGQLIKTIDQAGSVTQYGYNVYSQQTVITDALGHPSYKFYDLAGRVISTSNALGQVTTYQYDAGDRVTLIANAEGYTTTRQYDEANNVLVETDLNGHATHYGYDANNRVITVTNALGGVKLYAYDAVGNPVRITDAEGHSTTQEYDALDRGIRTIDALSNTLTTTYDPVSNKIAETDARGNTTRIHYDALNRPITVTDPLSGTTVTHYDIVGNKVAVIDAAGNATRYTYDVLNRAVAITDALGYVARTEYDAVGNRIAVTDTRGSVMYFAYDALQRNIIMTDTVGSTAYVAYDALGKQLVLTDAFGSATRLGYDRLNRVAVITDALHNATRYLYDRAGNRTGVIDGRGYTTTAEFDALNRLITLTAPLTRTVYTYDRVGNPLSVTDRRGATTRLAYDALGRVITATDALGGQTIAQYDANGNRLSTRDAEGRFTRYAYDALDRPIVITDALGYASYTAYDVVGNRSQVTDTRGFATRYAYDALYRLITTTNALGGQTIQQYDAGGNLLRLQDAAGRVLRKEYDAAGRVITVTDPLSGTIVYAYDVNGNRISVQDANGHMTYTGYDVLNRTIVVTDALGFTSQTAYDAAGNQIVVTGTRGFATYYTYDAANRVISTTDVLGQVTLYEYDEVGNQTHLTDARGQSTRFGYDLLGRLLTVTTPINTVTTYAYDSVGNRLRLTDANGHTTHYAYDALNRIITTTDALDHFTVNTYDEAGNLIAERDPNDNVTRYGYDVLSRRVVMTDALQGRTLYAFDPVGNLLSTTDANGHTLRSAYDGLDRVVAITNALGYSAYKFYDGVGNVISETDGLGRIALYAYDALNRVITTTDALGGQAFATYDAAGNMVAKTDAEGRTTRLDYDALNHIITATNALNQIMVVRYDELGNTLAEIDTLGRITAYEYDALNRQVVVTDALGYASRAEYDAVGNQIATSDALGNMTRYGYDELNRQIVVTDALLGVTTASYDEAGNPIESVDAEGRVTQFAYDALHRLITTTDALSGTLVNGYDAVGNPILEIDAAGRVTRLEYDAVDQPITVTDALNNVTTVAYDAVGNRIAQTDAAGRTTTYVYDALNRVITLTNPLSGTQGMRYDRVGNLIASTDAEGRATTSSYDALNKPLTVTDALSGTTSYEYNAVGQVIRQIDAEQQATTFAYDALDQVVVITDRLNHPTYLEYDAVGNQTVITDVRGSATRTVYDALGRVTQEINPLGYAKQYVYDRVGNQVVVTDASGIALYNTFDALNHPIEIRDALGKTTRYVYDRVGNPQVITDANGVATFNEYDALDRLAAVIENYQPDQPASASVNVRTSYGFDRVGNRTVITDGNGHVSHNVYDALNRLIATDDPLTHTFRFQYDQVGNLIGRLDANGITTTIDYDALNRVSRMIYPESTVTFQYDRVGNRLVMTDALGVSRYEYDDVYRLTYSSDPYTGTLRYGYDEVGNRTVITYPAGQVMTSIYDAANQLIVMRDWLTGTTTYAYDPAGRVLTTTLPNGTSTVNGYDGAGHPIRTTHYDTTEAILADYQYEVDGLGNRVVATETLRLPPGGPGSVAVTVRDTAGQPQVDLPVYAFTGNTYTGHHGTTNASGQVTLTLPSNAYRFRADKNGTQFWSTPTDACAVPLCTSAAITISLPLTVTVVDTNGAPQTSLPVYAFNGHAYTGYHGTTDALGQVSLTLPLGNYRFRADKHGTQFWSEAGNHCPIPGCTAAAITVSIPTLVTVLNDTGAAENGLPVYAFDGTTYTGYHGTTDAAGQVTLTLPLGNYRFRADKNSTQFWSGADNHCPIPGCTTAAITVSVPMIVTVLDDTGAPENGLPVYAFNESTYTGYHATTDAAGQVTLTLPFGQYRFRADKNGTQFWSGTNNHCSIPGCMAAAITTSIPTLVTVLDPNGAPEVGLSVYAFNGITYTGYSGVTNASGQVTLTLPAGSYRFRADKNGTQFWSGATNHCPLPGCSATSITTSLLTVITVQDSIGAPESGLPVYAFDDDIYTGYNATTNAAGQVTLTLPFGDYRFRVDKNGTQFWSGADNHCAVPGCTTVAVTTSLLTVVTVQDTDGLPQAGLPIYAFNDSTYTGYNGTTDATGQVTLTLPAGNYRFRTDKNSTQFWSGADNHCAVPGCVAVSISVAVPMVVTLQDSDGAPQAGLPVYGFTDTTYTGYHGTTDASGQVTLTLPLGSYRFRADKNGTQFWSEVSNHCAIPGCTTVTVTVSVPTVVNVTDTDGTPQVNLPVYAFDGTTYTGYHATTDASGQVTLTLPFGFYRFRVDKNGTQFWSGAENHCLIAGCTVVTTMVSVPLIVSVQDTDGMMQAGLTVYAFDEATYTGYHATTDAMGQVTLTLPLAPSGYRFRTDKNGTQFWSDVSNHCLIPGCTAASITVAVPVVVTVQDKAGTGQANIAVYAFNETTYTGYHGATNAVGQVTLTLPLGNYRFRADRALNQYWSSASNHCMVPGCYSASVILASGTASPTYRLDGAAPLSTTQGQSSPGRSVPVKTTLPISGDPTSLLLAPLAVLVMAGKRRRRSWWAWGLVSLLLILSLTGMGVLLNGGWDTPVALASGLNTPTAPVSSVAQASSTTTTVIRYTYDPLYRLTEARATGSQVYTYTYSYDAVGNRLTENGPAGAKIYSYDAANRITSVNGMPYTFDANGNQLSDGMRTFTYNSANRLTSVVSGTHTTQYAYNGAGTRLAQIVDGATTRYVVDVSGYLPQVVEEHATGSVTRYLYGNGLIGFEKNGARSYQHGDALGSVRQTTNEAGVVQQANDYDPFGNVIRTVGLPSSSFGYAREQYDVASGLIFLRARYYDPASGRFLNRDTYPAYASVPQTLHRYVYVKNSPINHTDPAGLCPWYDPWCIGEKVGNGLKQTYGYVATGVQKIGQFVGNTAQKAGQFVGNTVQKVTRFASDTKQKAIGFVSDKIQEFEKWKTEKLDYIDRKAMEYDPFGWPLLKAMGRGVRDYFREDTGAKLWGLGVIAVATIATGGMALVPIMFAAEIAVGIDYGMQVFENYESGMTGSEAWVNIDWKRTTGAAFSGMVSAAAAEFVGPLMGGGGFVKTVVRAFASGRVGQAAANLSTGKHWNEDLWNPVDIALDVIPDAFGGIHDANRPHVGDEVPPLREPTADGPHRFDEIPGVKAEVSHAETEVSYAGTRVPHPGTEVSYAGAEIAYAGTGVSYAGAEIAYAGTESPHMTEASHAYGDSPASGSTESRAGHPESDTPHLEEALFNSTGDEYADALLLGAGHPGDDAINQLKARTPSTPSVADLVPEVPKTNVPTSPGFTPGEISAAQQRAAAAWSKQGVDVADPLVQQAIQRGIMPIAGGSGASLCVVEICGGTGEFMVKYLQANGGRGTVIDKDNNFKWGRDQAKLLGLENRIEFMLGDALKIDPKRAGAPADVVIALAPAHTISQVEELGAATARYGRKPGATLYVLTEQDISGENLLSRMRGHLAEYNLEPILESVATYTKQDLIDGKWPLRFPYGSVGSTNDLYTIRVNPLRR
ncbi:partial tRNA nuclease WapA, partial [Thermoflexales bacterium]